MNKSAHDRKVFFLAVNTGYVDCGDPTERQIDFYRKRSGNGLHSAIVGNAVVPGGVGSNDVCAVISTSAIWSRIAKAIRTQGAHPGLQLATAWQGYTGNRVFVPKNREAALDEYVKLAGSMKHADVEMLFTSLMKGSELAVDHGFSHLQLHAAHGYLFNLLLDSRLSPLAREALEYTRRWALHMTTIGVETSIRVSVRSGHPSLDENDCEGALQRFCELGVNYIDLSEGFYNINKRLIYPTSSTQIQDRLSRSLAAAASHPDQAFIISGKVLDAMGKTPINSLPNNIHIGLCRDLIANPNFLGEQNSGCTNCMKCHYHSRGQPELSCGRWETTPTSPN